MKLRLSAPVVGRGRELTALRSALEDTAGGMGRCVVIDGPGGMGKSRLLAEAASEAEGRGIAVAAGQATELDRVAPLAVLLNALRNSLPPVVDSAGLAALGSTGGQANNHFWLVEQLGERIEEYVRSRPLLIVLDDAHLTDELTSVALQILVPRLRSCGIMWLLARRPGATDGPVHHVVDRLLEDGAHHISLSPLGHESIAELCAHLVGGPPDSRLSTLAARSGGNPFLLEQLLAMLDDRRLLRSSGGMVTSVIEDGLPSGFLSAVDYQLRHLSEPARSLLEAGAVFGRPFTVQEAATLLGRPAVNLVRAVEEAVRGHVLVDSGDALAFRHDLVREAVYGRLPGSIRQTLHQEATSLLEAAGAPGAEVVLHRIRGARKGDPRSVAALSSAVDKVAATAPRTAADLMLQLLGLLPVDSPTRPRAVAEAVRLLAACGRLTEARDLGETALHGGVEPLYEASMSIGLAEALKHAGQDEAVLEYTRRALDHEGVPQAVRAQLLSIQAHALLATGDFDAAEGSAAAATVDGEPAAVVYAQAARSAVARARGAVDEAIAIASDAVTLADEEGGDARHHHPRLWLGRALVAADRFREARAVYQLGQREAADLGTAWSQSLWHLYQAELLVAEGEFDDAESEALAGESVARQLNTLAVLPSLLGLLSEVAVHQDKLSRARHLLRQAEQLGEAENATTAQELAWPQARLLAAQDRPRDALATLRDVYASLPERPLLLTLVPHAGPAMVGIALDAASRSDAEVAAAAIRRLADTTAQSPSLMAAAHHAEGLLHDDLDALRAAVAAYGESPRRIAGAAAREHTARAEAGAGGRDRAVSLLEEALELYRACGATRDTARAQRELRRLGVRRRKWQQISRPQSGWDSLTGAELRVVRLVAEGMTNRATAARLFLSPHTVDTHLRRAFAKLDVSSRVELARQVMVHDHAHDRVKA